MSQRQYRGGGIVLMLLGVLGLVYGFWLRAHTLRGRGVVVIVLGVVFLLIGAYRMKKHQEVNQGTPPAQVPPQNRPSQNPPAV